MRRLRVCTLALTPLALAALLSGCTLTVRSGGGPPTFVHGQAVIAWAQLGLQFTFPGVVVIERHESPHHFATVFDSEASLRGVYGDVDERMRERGWHRERYEDGPNRVVAVYRRGEQEARVTVVGEGRSGRYRLNIDD